LRAVANIADPERVAKNSMRVEYLGHVYERLNATIASADRFVNFAGIIAAATLTAGILGNKPLIAILAPYALTIVFVYQLQLYTDAERYAVLVRHLEGLLNTEVGEQIFFTEKVSTIKYRNRWSVKGIQIAYGVVLATIFVVSLITTRHRYGNYWLITDIAGFVACFALLTLTMRELRQASRFAL
jgi:hypothetical protein